MLKWLVPVISLISFLQVAQARPFAEYEKVKFLAMSAEVDYQTHTVKRLMVEHLPEDVELIIYAADVRFFELFKEMIKDLPASKRLHTLRIRKSGQAFWTRDVFPQAIRVNGKYTLVDAQHPKTYEPDQEIAEFFKLDLSTVGFPFEHGNIMSNRQGVCMLVNSVIESRVPDLVFQRFYGCKKVIRFDHKVGIGHIDEAVKFIDDENVVTSYQPFVEVLEANGFKVKLLPETGFDYRSYINSVIVNKTIYVPIFNMKTDNEALQVYESYGFKVVPIFTSHTADAGGGGLHCLSMTYPDFNE